MKEIQQLMNSGPIAEGFKKSAKAVEKWVKLRDMVTGGPGKSNKIALLGKKNAWEKECNEKKLVTDCKTITEKIMNNEADAKKNKVYEKWASEYENKKKQTKALGMMGSLGSKTFGKKSAISALKAKAKAGLTGEDLKAAEKDRNLLAAIKHLNNYPKEKRQHIVEACKTYGDRVKQEERRELKEKLLPIKPKKGGKRTRRRKRKTRRRRKKRNRKSRIKKKGGRKSHRK